MPFAQSKVKTLLWASLCCALGCYSGPGEGRGSDSGGDDAGDGAGELQGPGNCVETQDFFRENVWAPFMSTQCFACHNPSGQAKHTDLVLQANDVPGYFEANLATVQKVARLEIEGTSLLLLKPTAAVEHGGGLQIQEGDERYEALAELVRQLDAPVHCADDGDYDAYFAGVELMDPEQVLRRATGMLASRLPTDEELEKVRSGGEAALDEVLREVMHEPMFSTRLMEMYNDQLLTDAYLPGTRAIDLLDENDYPNARWFDAMADGPAKKQARNRSNDALAREPLQLISWIVENDRPFSEIVTADYTVANGYLARVYGLDLEIFDDPDDPGEWRQVQIEGIPHAGVLTTPAFLNRYPTTETNRNRERARITYEYFLATDIMQLGSRPIDTDAIADHNPTMYNPACTSCHEIIDPLAGTYQNWDETGRYKPRTWYQDMRPPGFKDTFLPTEQNEAALQWLGSMMVQDARFSRAIVNAVYFGMTGQKALEEPTDPTAVDYVAQIRAFEVQDYVFKNVASAFADRVDHLRTLIIELVKTPYFRATNVDEIDPARALELAELGAVRLTTPEQLHRRIAEAVGYPYNGDNGSLLLRGRPYHLMYGGIDSDVVTARLPEINGVMVNVAERMANEMACLATGQDFAKPAAERLLFPEVEIDDLPGVDDAAIRNNIVYLHERLLGETLDADDPEVERTYQLFLDVQGDGISGIAAGEYAPSLIVPCRATDDPNSGDPLAEQIVEDPDYTIRAWMAVVSAMLADFRFLYE